MDLSAVFLLLAVILLVALFVVQPLTRRQRRLTEAEHALSALLAERDRLLNALEELEFDFSLGKIPAENYPAQRVALVQRGAEVLRQIDALTPSRVPAGLPEDRLEAAITARRAALKLNPASAGVTNDDLEDLIAKRRSARREKAAGFCPQCGKPVLQSDIFCSACGHALQ
jgi:hypothetical protein